jgi:1-phosphofructokinase
MTRGKISAAMPGRPTICVFSPAPLLEISVESTLDGTEELHLHPGGQGFWVGRMALTLGARVGLSAPFGGETGDVLQRLLEDSGITIHAVPMPSPNGGYVVDRRHEEPRELWRGELRVLGRHELDELYTVTLAAGIAAGVCVLTGTHRQEIVEPDAYRRLASDLTANGTRVVADLAGPLLQAALEGGVHLLKMSHEELEADGWAGGGSEDDVVHGMERLRAAGAENVVVSMAGDGAIAYLGEWLRVKAPAMEVVEHRGAGDSMTAAFAVAAALGLEAEAAARLAAAAGAVNVTRHGLGTGRADAIEQLAAKVEVEQLGELSSP